nr:DUF4190 domain-containing protein [Microbacterium lemovicicum]
MTDPNGPANSQPPAYSPPPAAGQPAPYNSAPPVGSGDYGSTATTYPGKTLGIVAVVVAIFFNVIGLILGIVALVQSRKVGRKNGPAVAAIIIGAILIIVGIILTLAVVIPTFSAASTCASDPTAIVNIWGVQVPCSEVVTDR